MTKERFEIIEEDDVVIYDERDDYDPGEDEESEEFHLMTNEEIFTDEYMREYAARMDAKIKREKQNDKLISIGVVAGVIVFIAAVTYFSFKDLI